MQKALIDKLCERLAVEIGGVEIYQAILSRLPGDDELTRRLRRFQAEEARHRDLLSGYLDRLGVSDRETPSARLARLEAHAFLKLIDEAETPAQLLDVLLTVELMDETAWELLINLARDLGDEAMLSQFADCLRHEKEHLMKVRGAVAERLRAELSGAADVL